MITLYWMELSNNSSEENIYTQNISKERAIQALTGVNNDPKKAFSAQLAIIQTSCQKISGVSQINDWSPVTSLISRPYRDRFGTKPINAGMGRETIIPQNLHCKFPTMEVPENGN